MESKCKKKGQLPNVILNNILKYVPINKLRSRKTSPALVNKTWADAVFRITWKNLYLFWGKREQELDYLETLHLEVPYHDLDIEYILQPTQCKPLSLYSYQKYGTIKKTLLDNQNPIFDYKNYIRHVCLKTHWDSPLPLYHVLASIPNLTIDSFHFVVKDTELSHLTEFFKCGLSTNTLIISHVRTIFTMREESTKITTHPKEYDPVLTKIFDVCCDINYGSYHLIFRRAGRGYRPLDFELSALMPTDSDFDMIKYLSSPFLTSLHNFIGIEEEKFEDVLQFGEDLKELSWGSLYLDDEDNEIILRDHAYFNLPNLERLHFFDSSFQSNFLPRMALSSPKLTEFTFYIDQRLSTSYMPTPNDFKQFAISCPSLQHVEIVIRKIIYDDETPQAWLGILSVFAQYCQNLKEFIHTPTYDILSSFVHNYETVYAKLITRNPNLKQLELVTDIFRRPYEMHGLTKWPKVCSWFQTNFSVTKPIPDKSFETSVIHVDLIRYLLKVYCRQDSTIFSKPNNNKNDSSIDWSKFNSEYITKSMISQGRSKIGSLYIPDKSIYIYYEDDEDQLEGREVYQWTCEKFRQLYNDDDSAAWMHDDDYLEEYHEDEYDENYDDEDDYEDEYPGAYIEELDEDEDEDGDEWVDEDDEDEWVDEDDEVDDDGIDETVNDDKSDDKSDDGNGKGKKGTTVPTQQFNQMFISARNL